MVELVTGLRLVSGVVLLLSNGFFVTTEFALTRVRQFSPEEFEGPGLERAWEMTERLEIFLSGCQVGITVSSIGLGVVAEPAVAAVLDPIVLALGFAPPSPAGHTTVAVVVGFLLINLLHVIIGEQAPTYLGIERTKLVARYGAPLLYWWTMLMYPVIVVADRVAKGLLGVFGVTIDRSWTDEALEEGASRGELRRQMGEALLSAGIDAERREEVMNALAIGRMPVTEVMNPREEIAALSTDDDLEAVVERIGSTPHGRFPLVDGSLENLVGFVYTPALFEHWAAFTAGELDLADVAAPPMTVEADVVVSELIDRFQAENQELALVVDDGEVIGLVTATDAFEAITGELEDPIDLQFRESE